MKYWLVKSEPHVFSIDDLQRVKSTLWEGIRNYQARNFMMNDMAFGDEVLFYHSRAEPPGLAGRARVVRTALPDPSQFDRKSEYFAVQASPEKPIWFAVSLEFVEKFPRLIPLAELRREPKLKDMLLLRKGQRLSIQPVTPQEFNLVCKLC